MAIENILMEIDFMVKTLLASINPSLAN